MSNKHKLKNVLSQTTVKNKFDNFVLEYLFVLTSDIFFLLWVLGRPISDKFSVKRRLQVLLKSEQMFNQQTWILLENNTG